MWRGVKRAGLSHKRMNCGDRNHCSHKKNARLICYYLPQFHPIPENDRCFGKGFTEWTNVAKARPLFPGHYQPHVPADLGFYDLRLPEARAAQAQLAQEYAIEGFCYWHYWFAGRRLLQRPFQEVLRSGEPKLPFCLAWANETWTAIWQGRPNEIIVEQTYPGRQDDEAHFYALLDAFCDARYIKVDGKPLFYVYKPHQLPEPKRFVEHWQDLAVKNGLKGVYFVGEDRYWIWNPKLHGFDATVPSSPGIAVDRLIAGGHTLTGEVCCGKLMKLRTLTVLNYSDFVGQNQVSLAEHHDCFPSVLSNWDNTPRAGINGVVLRESTPDLFRLHLRRVLQQIADRPYDKRIVFVKSWNKWAEGNHLEPDLRYGWAYLQVCKDEILE